MVVAASLALVTLTTGVGLAADHSIPGDRLYRVDVLVEEVTDAVGLTNRHSAERFEEAASLLGRDDVTGALETAWVGAREDTESNWSPPLQTALVHVEHLMRSDEPEASSALAELLSAAVQLEESPDEAGLTIADVARDLPVPIDPPGLDPEATPPGLDPLSPPSGVTPPPHDVDDGPSPPVVPGSGAEQRPGGERGEGAASTGED